MSAVASLRPISSAAARALPPFRLLLRRHAALAPRSPSSSSPAAALLLLRGQTPNSSGAQQSQSCAPAAFFAPVAPFRRQSRRAPGPARLSTLSTAAVAYSATADTASTVTTAAAAAASSSSARSSLPSASSLFLKQGGTFVSPRQRHNRAFSTTAAAAMAGPTHDARIVSYNVLSSSLCEPAYFTHCAPEDLDPPARLAKVLAKLEPEMAKGAVIGLQEVSQKWAGELHVFFAARGYHLVCSLYGKPFNGYMGIAMAIPLGKYTVSKVDISRCSDTGPRLPKDPEEPERGVLKKIFVDFPVGVYRLATGAQEPRKEQSDWALARNRFNTIQYATLKCKETGVEFGVANYHMPCMFRNPQVMTIHSQLAGMYAQRMAGDLPAVLIGDFNLKPGDGGYDLITTGTLASDHLAFPVPPKGGKWETKMSYPMRSAYKVKDGKEPDFTNHAQIKDDPPFIDTLDYIFISPTVEVTEVMPLKNRSEVKGPFPAPTEPSDHVMIAATVRIPGA